MIAAVVAEPASAQGSQSADQQLAAKYAPVLYAAIQLTLSFFDLEAREGAEPVAAG